MAEIKVAEGFDAEIKAFKQAGLAIQTDTGTSDSAGGVSLSTVDEYRNRMDKIKKMISMFIVLTKKDADDMNALVKMFRDADSAGRI